MTHPPPPCVLLDWDTDFFGFRTGRVRGNTLTGTLIEQIENWRTRNHIRCLYFLARSDDGLTTRLAEAHGFHLTDLRVTLECKIPAPPPQKAEFLRPAREDDLPTLTTLARAGFTDSRFFYDPGFPRERAEALYEAWVRRDFGDSSAIVLVAASAENLPLGYISCQHRPGQDTAQIGLMGVSASARGRSAGQTLVNGALAWAAGRGAVRVTVVTQGRNVAAQRLYQRCGFLTRSVELWYHKWYDSEEDQYG
ncbi:MAG: GNAT family N-acetyltransferase [Chloroflexota bacterium]